MSMKLTKNAVMHKADNYDDQDTVINYCRNYKIFLPIMYFGKF